VELFFNLSGFLMGKIYIQQPYTYGNVMKYGLARIGRILPLYYLVLAASTFGCQCLDMKELYCKTARDWKAWILLEAHDAPLWTVPLELHYYCFFLIVWFVKSRCFHAFFITWLFVYIMATLKLVLLELVRVNYLPPFLTDEFCWCQTLTESGFRNNQACLLAYLPFFLVGTWMGDVAIPKESTGFASTVGAFAMIGLMANNWSLRKSCNLLMAWTIPASSDDQMRFLSMSKTLFSITYWDPLTWVVVSLLVICTSYSPPSLRILSTPAAQMLGRVSFCCYLIHLPTLRVAREAFGCSWPTAFVAFFVVVFCANISFDCYESRMQEKIRNLACMRSTLV